MQQERTACVWGQQGGQCKKSRVAGEEFTGTDRDAMMKHLMDRGEDSGFR